MKLIIVESPTKAKTISKFLSSEYVLESSYGHIRDLPKSQMGIDIENNFEPKYIIPTAAKKNVTKLKKLAEKAEEIILASDEDREGEAIAWHLTQALKIPAKNAKRIVFHEITKPAIIKALESPRKLDIKMVEAQQARRILDRLVGYEMSPFLWKKVAKGLSAGRVQSVSVRLVVERERERQAFKNEEYWSLEADFRHSESADLPILAKLNKIDNKVLDKLAIKSEAEAEGMLKNITDASYKITKLESKTVIKNPLAPFTTSSLQQTANRWLGFSAKQTMTIAQQLYETGLITYMRTDSLNLSQSFISDAKKHIESNLGKEYIPDTPRTFKNRSKGAQEAHEAVRPTSAHKTPEALEKKLTPHQHKLYRLIWQRAIASQMANAKVLSTSLNINTTKDGLETAYQFRGTGQIIQFLGYLKVYPEKSQEVQLPELKEKDNLNLKELEKKQHSTQPPARYSDAGLVKELEKHGIGRPSTYAPTISTIIARNYVNRDDSKRLFPTDIAFVVIDLLTAHFPKIVDFEFTAQMENSLDDISTGEKKWVPVIDEFYQDFHKNLEKKYEEIDREDIFPEKETKEICDKCGAKMIIKTGRYGKFLACSTFPDCKNIKPIITDKKGKEQSEEATKLQKKYSKEVCSKCGSEMVIKTGRFGPFLACTGFPKCKNIKSIAENDNTTDITCPKCNTGKITKKFSKRGVFYACDNYPDCKNAYWAKPTGDKCPECKALLVEDKSGTIKCSNKECKYEK